MSKLYTEREVVEQWLKTLLEARVLIGNEAITDTGREIIAIARAHVDTAIDTCSAALSAAAEPVMMASCELGAEECAHRCGTPNICCDYYIVPDASPAAPQGEAVALRQENELLRTALRFYANGDNYHLDSSEDFDTVSGEPQSWLCSGLEDSETMVENGEVARHALMGHVIGWEDAEEDHTPQPIAGEAPFSAAALQTAFNCTSPQPAAVAEVQCECTCTCDAQGPGYIRPCQAAQPETQGERYFTVAGIAAVSGVKMLPLLQHLKDIGHDVTANQPLTKEQAAALLSAGPARVEPLSEQDCVALAKSLHFRRHDGVYGMDGTELAVFANAVRGIGKDKAS